MKNDDALENRGEDFVAQELGGGGLNIESCFDLDPERAQMVENYRELIWDNYYLDEERKLRKNYDPLTFLSG